MKKRNRLITAGALGASAAAIWAGMLVTSSAIANEPQVDTVAVSMISVDETGEAILCEFEDVAVAIAADGGTLISGSAIVEDGAGFQVAAPLPADGELGVVVGTATAIVADGSIPEAAFGTITVGTDGTIEVLGEAQAPRLGTDEECAALRPESVPGFGQP